ncbi:transposase [Lachnospiraceae bacterium Oil+RF-744-WCA-WT-13]|uniref:Transposase n=2 Tax=Bilifractor porci TaxID=2606636 RepID=A0A7X2P961_9FIRM|nr:transposase [Bilifractor porci]
MMYPNANFFRFFPDSVPNEDRPPERSGCLRIGTFVVVRKILQEYKLDETMNALIGRDSGLFLDLAAYTLVTEGNVAQYYPEYAFNHPLFTEGMHVYSDSKVCDFLKGITPDQIIMFQNTWNEKQDHREKIYISYDSTNKNCQAGDLECVEFGHPKQDNGKPVFNYSVAYNNTNSVPLFYEEYPGSITDVSQLQIMLEKAKGYGYHEIGFILDRGYFSRENIRYMDKNGFDFIIMMKGMKSLAHEIVTANKGRFEDEYSKNIRGYNVYGMTVHQKLFPSDENDRYFHIYYSDSRKASEKGELTAKIARLAKYFKKHQNQSVHFEQTLEHYFDLIYWHEGQKDEKFLYARERTDVINREISFCGYFVIITSAEMTASKALELYKSRDVSEKLFRADKCFLGNRTMRAHMNETENARIFVEFVALIVRNRIYHQLIEQEKQSNKKRNYMTVPAAIRELEKIEIIQQPDHRYRLNYAVTATQKEILKAFGINEVNIKKWANEISAKLSDEMKEAV